MDKKQVIIVALLLIAVVLSASSVMMNAAVLKTVQINQASSAPNNGDITFEIEDRSASETTNGGANG